MSQDTTGHAPDGSANPDDVAIVGWLRWWHWLALVGLFLFGFAYFPLWRFEQHWRSVQLGDSLERVKQLLGDPGEPNYSVRGTTPSGSYESYTYMWYGKIFEVQVSPGSQRVIAKNVSTASGQSSPPFPPNVPGGGVVVRKR